MAVGDDVVAVDAVVCRRGVVRRAVRIVLLFLVGVRRNGMERPFCGSG